MASSCELNSLSCIASSSVSLAVVAARKSVRGKS
ncbi:unnamed protein product [Protopolystoma xenopodis]|uniref:Uncharacterized protein n=1 Tax=Protopolystoma xenopodis TaxID=117903 RepID=A0A3S5AFM4_9PLAT|nr:unnamed protein product [Protopolystoma xenopodis]